MCIERFLTAGLIKEDSLNEEIALSSSKRDLRSKNMTRSYSLDSIRRPGTEAKLRPKVSEDLMSRLRDLVSFGPELLEILEMIRN